MGTLEFEELRLQIKEKIRSQNLTYKEVALRIGMSVSGLKKLLAAKDISLTRLGDISEALGVRVTDLIHGIESKDHAEVSFTQRQEEYFLKNMDCFYFYWKLVYERMSTEEIAKKYNLVAKDIKNYLRRLDEMELLKIRPDGRVWIPPVQAVYWVGQSRFVHQVYQEFAHQMMHEIAKPNSSTDETFIIRYFRARPSTIMELRKALKKLETEFMERAIREMRLNLKGLKDLRWISAVDTKSFVNKVKS